MTFLADVSTLSVSTGFEGARKKKKQGKRKRERERDIRQFLP